MPASARTRWAVAYVIRRSVTRSAARCLAAASARALASRVIVMIVCCWCWASRRNVMRSSRSLKPFDSSTTETRVGLLAS